MLDIIDFSESTACRNEPNEVEGSWLSGFGYELLDEGLDSFKVAELHGKVLNSGYIRSDRDRFRTSKKFLTPLGKAYLPIISRRKVRKSLSYVGSMRNPHEWKLPRLAMNAKPFLPVLKLNSCPIWAEKLVQLDPNVLILHNIRQPYAYLNSWYNRFIHKQKTASKSFIENFSDVPCLLQYFGRSDSARLSEVNLENIVEVELWRWRYVNERIANIEDSTDQYLRVNYEEVDAGPVCAAHKVYNFLGIDFSESIINQIEVQKNVLFPKRHGFELDPHLIIKLMGRVLEDSPLDQAFEGGFVRP